MPVLWMQGTSDVVYSVERAQQGIKMFVDAPEAKLDILPGGVHYLGALQPKQVDEARIDLAGKRHKA